MKPSENLSLHRDVVRHLVAESNMANPRLFGSALHGDDTEARDLDILVDPSPETSLLHLVALQIRIEEVLRTKVDLLTPNSLPRQFRDAVLAEAASL